MTPSGLEPTPAEGLPVVHLTCPHCGCRLPPVAQPARKATGLVSKNPQRMAETVRIEKPK